MKFNKNNLGYLGMREEAKTLYKYALLLERAFETERPQTIAKGKALVNLGLKEMEEWKRIYEEEEKNRG